MEGIPHYLIDVLDPRDDFNVATFQTLAARQWMRFILIGNIPIITGGTGFYIRLCCMILTSKRIMKKSYP